MLQRYLGMIMVAMLSLFGIGCSNPIMINEAPQTGNLTVNLPLQNSRWLTNASAATIVTSYDIWATKVGSSPIRNQTEFLLNIPNSASSGTFSQLPIAQYEIWVVAIITNQLSQKVALAYSDRPIVTVVGGQTQSVTATLDHLADTLATGFSIKNGSTGVVASSFTIGDNIRVEGNLCLVLTNYPGFPSTGSSNVFTATVAGTYTAQIANLQYFIDNPTTMRYQGIGNEYYIPIPGDNTALDTLINAQPMMFTISAPITYGNIDVGIIWAPD